MKSQLVRRLSMSQLSLNLMHRFLSNFGPENCQLSSRAPQSLDFLFGIYDQKIQIYVYVYCHSSLGIMAIKLKCPASIAGGGRGLAEIDFDHSIFATICTLYSETQLSIGQSTIVHKIRFTFSCCTNNDW